ncbi:MAG: hypothetical protein KUA35_09065 [Pseudodesulfovibrio sp.]|nr:MULTISPECIES: hypothetical protein [Pseudodesulfovibrio]MBU4192890.1 hypothetical protein [Pseudomonadota bacterium]MBU4244513.1 hypothetical protein [Pseudomonadota bacterium]MBU4379853.1 hypothetical protein [Pseudomonadota bacterium]MBU4476523.1 hypothetical protein [Pseudomonadota bacterium]MBU4516258.1 hypothetical protein [Pseudomonadota bacterium]
MVLCLTLCAACSGRPKVVTVTEVVRVVPPAHLMAPTPLPSCASASTNGDLLQCAQERLEALQRANADKEAIARTVEVRP